MQLDQILAGFNRHAVQYLLIGGVNFLLRHHGPMTVDIDLWIHDTKENRGRCEQALRDLGAEWGPTETDWGPVSRLNADWLARQYVFCLNSSWGAIDIFRSVAGLGNWLDSAQRAISAVTPLGTPYRAISDHDMLNCQLALDPAQQKNDRVRRLHEALKSPPNEPA